MVQSVDSGTPSGNSLEASAVPVLLPPTNLVAAPGDGFVKLSWTPSPSNGSPIYRVKRTTQAPDVVGRTWTTVDNGTTANPWTDNAVVNNQIYFYVVQAADFSGAELSVDSNEVAATPIPPPPTPSGLTALAGNRQVTLSWPATSTATSYLIRWATSSGGTYSTLTTTSALTYVHTGLTNGNAYWYRINASNDSGTGNNFGPVSATPRMPAPVLSGRPKNQSVELTWSAVPNAVGYRIRRGTSTGNLNQVQTVTGTTTYTDTGRTNGTTYFYAVRAYDGTDESVNSNDISATPSLPPPAPTGLTATAGVGSVALSWNAAAGATSYNIRRGVSSGGPYSVVGNTAGTTFSNTGLTSGTTYYYVVSAVGVGESLNSNEASVILLDGWVTSSSISCAGIRPLPFVGGQTSFAPGSFVRLSSFLAVDYDQRLETVDGVTITRIFTDPCTYSWSSGSGSTEYGLTTGQNIVWIAPSTPGNYTVVLTVDDQNSGNQSVVESGGRNDDPPLTFSIVIPVQ